MLSNKEGLQVLTLERISPECPGTNLSPHLQDFLGHFLHSTPSRWQPLTLWHQGRHRNQNRQAKLITVISPPTLQTPAREDANEFKEHLWLISRAFTLLKAADCKEPHLSSVPGPLTSPILYSDEDLTERDNGMFNLRNSISIELDWVSELWRGLNKLDLVNGWWSMGNSFLLLIVFTPHHCSLY